MLVVFYYHHFCAKANSRHIPILDSRSISKMGIIVSGSELIILHE